MDQPSRALREAMEFATKFTSEDYLKIAQSYFRKGWEANIAHIRLHHRSLEEIHEERIRQDAKWGGPEHDDGHLSTEWTQIIRHHLGSAGDAAYRADPAEYRRYLVNVAALAVAAMESYDRKEDSLSSAADVSLE